METFDLDLNRGCCEKEIDKKERVKERMETKLYVLRDIDGNPNREELKIIRGIEKELEKFPFFIGISLYGSVSSGYNIENSDIDIIIFYDKKILESEKNPQDSYNEFKKLLGNISYKNEQKGKKIHIDIIDISSIISLKDLSEEEDVTYFFDSLSSIFRVITGNKINFYRELFLREFNKMDESEKEGFFIEIINAFVANDSSRFYKRMARIKNLDRKEHENIFKERRKMWEKRVSKILGINN